MIMISFTFGLASSSHFNNVVLTRDHLGGVLQLILLLFWNIPIDIKLQQTKTHVWGRFAVILRQYPQAEKSIGLLGIDS